MDPRPRLIAVPVTKGCVLLLTEQEFTTGIRCGRGWRRRQAMLKREATSEAACVVASGARLPAKEISDRLTRTFLRNEEGRRPVFGGTEKFQSDPHWRDLILFYEYFHGDNGAGLGASHQTGWTGCVAKAIELYGLLDAKKALEGGKKAAFKKGGV